MKQNVWKRAMSLFMALTMVLGLFPATVFAASVPETLVTSLAKLYEDDEERARADLEAMHASGLIDNEGNLASLDIREDGESAELSALAERIANGETVGVLTVNGEETAPEQIVKLSQVKAAIEIAQLLDEEIDVTDEHVNNLESLLTGITDGSVDLDNALQTGTLSLKSVNNAPLLGATGNLSETISKSDLPADGKYNLPSDASDTLHLLTLSGDGNKYVGRYLKGNEYDANHEFPFADTDLAYKEYYYTRPDTYSDRDQNRTPTANPPLGDYIDWDNVKWGLDGEQTFTLVLPLKSGDTVAQWLVNRIKPCSNLANPIEVSVPGYGTLKASSFATFGYCIREQQEVYGNYRYDLGKRRYPLFVAGDSNEKPVALVACIGVPRNPSALARMDRVSLFMEPSGNYYAISGSKETYISGYSDENDYCPEGSVYRINGGDPYFQHPDGTIKKLSNLEDQGSAGYVRYTLIDGCLLFGYHKPRKIGFPLLLDWSEAKTDDCGHFYFDMTIYSIQQLWDSYPPRVYDCEYTVASAALLNKSKFISRQADYTQADGGFIKLTNPKNSAFPYVYPGDPERPENQYDIELLATEDLYQILAGNGIIYIDKDLDLRFTWQFSNRAPFSDKTVDFSSFAENSALRYERNAAGEVVLTPISATETRFKIGCVAINDAVSANNGVSYDVAFPSVITREGTDPYLMIPTSSQVRETLTDRDTEIFFASNIQTRNRVPQTTFHAKLYRIEESQIGQPVPDTATPLEVSDWGEFVSSPSNPVTSIKVPGTALTQAGAYAVTISTEFIDGTTVTPFSVTAYLKVKNAPASIKLNPLTSYSAVIDSIPAIAYTVDSKAADVQVMYTIQPSGEDVSEMTPVSGGSIPFAPEFEGTKKAYTITVYARNTDEDPWSTDSMLLTVYSGNPIKLVVKDVPYGEVGGKTGGVAPEQPVTSITLDNSDTIEQLIEKIGQDGYSFDDFRNDVNLQELISADYGSGTLGIISDRLQWDAKEGNKTSNALALYHALNGPYADTRNDGFTYYIPTADILMVGTDNKSVTVTATHARTNTQTSVNVTVNTLKDKLYLFRFSPKAEVSLTYTDGKEKKHTVTTNAQGELALYEPNGIASDVFAIANAGGEIYVGTIMKRYLTSGEKDVVKLEVYPCNYLALRPISSQTLTFLKPDGKPYSGNVTLRGGVYANDEYCPNAGIRTLKNSVEQHLREDANVNVTNGKATVWFDPTQFPSTGDLRYVFEYRFEDNYLPGYVIVDPASNDPAESIVNLRAISGSDKVPAIIRQDYQQFLDGATPTGYTRSVIDSTENIGISKRFSKAVLRTEYALLGETVVEGEAIEQNHGYSTYGGEKVVTGALYTAGDVKLRGQTEASGSAKQITKLSDLNDSTTLFVFPFSAVPMLRSVYTMTDADLTSDGITDEGETPAPTARIKAVFTRGGLTVKSINMPFGVSNLSHQKDLSQPGNGAKEIGAEVRENLRETTDIGAIFKGINVNDMIRKGFVFLGNLSGHGGDNLINLMILPTQDPATFRIIAFVGANQRSDGDDDGVSVNFNTDDLAEDMDKFQKELEEMGKEDDNQSESDGEGSITFNFYGTIILEAHIGIADGNWDISFRGGNVGTNVAGKYEWGQNFMCGPVPAFISFEVGFTADLEVAFGSKDTVRAMLLDAALGVSIEAFAGLGFDMSLVALQLGIYGRIGADVNFLLLTPSNESVSTGTKLTISGEIGIKMKVKLLFISYSKNLASTGFNWTKKWSNYDQIKQYWTDQGFGQLFGTTRSGRAYTMYLFADGSTMVAIEGDAELESRDYLDMAERAWTGGAASSRRLLKAAGSATNAINNVQTNAYPYSHPAFTDDGEMFLYVSDNNNANDVQSVVSYAVKNGTGYDDNARVDVSEDNVLADLDVVASGTKENAFAAWVKQVEMPQTEKSVGFAQSDLGMMFNATEVYVSSYRGTDNEAAWTTTRLTNNTIADMSPTVASYDNMAIVAWRSMNASEMPEDTNPQDITGMFDVENNINYSVYDGSQWSPAQVAYNGNAGTVNAIDSAMLSDGTAILVYTVRTGDDVTTTETFYTVIKADGDIVTTGRLTNDSFTDTNAQVTAVNDADNTDNVNDGYFVLGWYSEHDAGEGTTVEYDAEGNPTQKAVVAHDIRLARINANGSYDIDFPESIGGSSDVGSDFHFSAPAKNTALTNVSIVWSQRKNSDEAEDAGKYELNAVRFFEEDSVTGLTAPTDIAETTKNYTIDHFDAYTDADGAIHAIILGSDYDNIAGINRYDSIDLDAAANNTVTSNSDSPKNLNILGGTAISSLKLATGTFPEMAADVTADIDISEVVPGLTTPVQFTVTNTGTGVLSEVTATVDEGNDKSEKTFSGLNLLPNQSATLIMYYDLPAGAVSDAPYTVKSGDTNLGGGTLALNRPDVGISGIKLLQEHDGQRDIQVMLTNGSTIPLAGSGKTVKLAFYKDALHKSRIGDAISISGDDDLADIDAGTYTTVQTLNVTDIVRLVRWEIPDEGLTVYAHAWIENPVAPGSDAAPTISDEPNAYNNDNFLSFTGPLARNNGEKLTTGTTLEVNTDGQTGTTYYTVYADFRNNSMQEQTFNVPIAVLLDSNKEVIAYKYLQNTEEMEDMDFVLDGEQQVTMTAVFTAEDVGNKTPAEVEIRYSYKVSFDVNGGTGGFESVMTDIYGHITLPEGQPTPPTNAEPLFFRGWYTSATGGALVTEESTFTEDSTIHAQYTAHQHVFEYAVTNDGYTISASCVSTVADDCPLEEQDRTATLTIVKPERDGQTAGNPNATITGATDVLGTPVIRYYVANEDGTEKTGEALSGVPYGIGKYWAEFTLGEGEHSATAHVVYDLIVDGNAHSELNSSYTVSYDLNGGTGTAPEGGTIYHGVQLTLPNSEGFSRSNLVFDGWNTKPGGTGDAYQAGDSFTVTGNMTFYAQWKHVHQWNLTYDASTKLFTQACGVPGCPVGTQTLRVLPVNKMYDGKNAQPYTCSDGWAEENGLTLPTVTFYRGGEEVSEAKNVGTYTASVSLYDRTISVGEFRITSRPVIIIADDQQMNDEGAEPIFTVSYDSVGEKLYFENDPNYPWKAATEGDRVYAKSGNGGQRSSTSTLTLKVKLEKAGKLSFDYKYGTEEDCDKCYFKLDNGQKFEVSGSKDWQNVSYNLSAGDHTLTWWYKKDSSADRNGDFFALDNVVITTEGAVTQEVSEEKTLPVDFLLSDSRFANDAAYPWKEVTEGGRTYVKSGNGGHGNTESTLTLNVTLEKAGKLYFDYKCGTEEYYDECYFELDGDRRFKVSGSKDWQNVSYDLSAGNHTLTWRYEKDSGSDQNGDFFALDNLSFAPPSVFNGLIADLHFKNDEAYPWKEVTEDGRTYAKSGNEGENEGEWETTSKLELDVVMEKAGTLTFDYKYGTEPDYGRCFFYVDGNRVKDENADSKTGFLKSGVEDWTPYSCILSAGDHTFTWSYEKMGGGANGDFFAIDNIVINTDGEVMQIDPTERLLQALNIIEGGIVKGETLNYTVAYENYVAPDEYPITVPITVTPGVNPNYTVQTKAGTLTVLESIKPKQTITAEDVTATFGDTDKLVSGSVTEPATDGGAISYAVKKGSEDYIDVDASTGVLTIKKVPADGKAYVTVTAAKTDIYARTTKDVTVTINPKAMTIVANDESTGVNGKPHGVTVTVTDPAEGYTVKYGTAEGSYTLNASPTKSDAGTLTVYYQVTADNYATTTGSVTLTLVPHTHKMSYALGTGENANTIIATCANEDGNCYLEDYKATLTITAPVGEIVYDGKAHPATITDDNDIQGDVKVLYAEKGGDETYGEAVETEPVNAGTYKASITLGSDEGAKTVSVEYEIKNAALTNVSVSQDGTLTYDGSAQTPQVTTAATAVNSQAVTFTYSKTQNGTYGDMPTFTNVADTGTVYFKASAPNHDPASGSFTVTVNKADQTAPNAPALDTARANMIKLTEVQGYQYSMDGLSWQNEATFTGLNRETQYNFYQRIAEDDNHNASPASAVAQFSTTKHDHNWGSFSATGATITATCANTDTFHPTEDKTATMVINAPTLKVYGGSGSAEATVTNGVEGVDTPTIVYKQGETTLDGAPTDAGTYTASITLTGVNTGADATGDVTASVTYTIDKALATVTSAPTPNSPTYTGAAQALVTAGTPNGGTMQYRVGTDDTTAPADGYSTTVPQETAANTYYVWYKVVGDSNHNNSEAACVPVTIGKANQTAPAVPAAESTSVSTITLTAIANGEYKCGDGAWQKSNEFTGLSMDTEYTFYQRYAADNNHNASESSASATIKTANHAHEWSYVATGATITATCANSDGGHDGNTSATIIIAAPTLTVYSGAGSAEATVTNGVEGVDTPTIVYKKGNAVLEAAPTAAGTYTASITLTGVNTGANATGDVTASVTYTISKVPLTVTANNKTITYGDAPTNAGVTYSGFVNSETESVLDGTLDYDYNYAQYGNVAGEYTITPKGLTSSNYDISFVPGTLTVNQKEVGLSWTNTSFTYNGLPQKPTATATGLVNGDAVAVTVSGAQTNVGDSYTATASALTGDKAGNYKLPTATTQTFAISKVALTVTANDKTITYGDAPSNNGVTYTGFVNGETETSLGGTLTYNYSYSQYGNVGSAYTITPSGLTSGNYNITFHNGTLTVVQKEVNLAWDHLRFDYDGKSHAPTAAVTNLVNNDTVNVTVTGAQVNTGNYTATASALTGSKASNYRLPAETDQNFSITEKDFAIAPVEIKGALVKLAPFAYDGDAVSTAEFDNDGAVPGANGKLVQGDDTKEVHYFYQSTAFLKSQTDAVYDYYTGGSETLTLGNGATNELTPTTFEPGKHYVLAVIKGNNYTNTYITQSVFEVTQNLDKVREAPAAPEVTDGVVTVAEADRAKTLEYSLDGNIWLPVSLDKDGKFTAEWQTPVTAASLLLRETADAKYAKPSASATGTATITTTTFTVVYDANGGAQAPDAVTVTSDRTVTAARQGSMTRTGYTFTGWNTAKNGTGTAYEAGSTLNEGVTLYAQWEANTYKVRFNANGGRGTMEEMSFTYNAQKTLDQNTFVREDYTFLGWAKSAGGNAVYRDGQSVKNLTSGNSVTLYAVWAKNVYNITGTVASPRTGEVTLTLVKGENEFGKQEVTYSTANEAVGFALTAVPAGMYNLIAEQNGVTMTVAVTITDKHVELGTITMPSGDTSSVMEVKGVETPAVVVKGLDELAANEEVDERSVTVTMTVETKTEAQTEAAGEAIRKDANVRNFEFMDITVTKAIYNNSVEETTEQLAETSNVIELAIPFDFSGKTGIRLYRYHVGEAQALTESVNSDSPEDGTFRLDRQSGLIYVYTSKFSTYAIGYSNESSGGGAAAAPQAAISKPTNGTVTIAPENAKSGEKVTITAKPDEGYEVDAVTVTDANGKAVSVTKVNDTTYTFTQPTGKVAIDVTFKAASITDALARFNDISTSDWYADAVRWAVDNGVMNGVSGHKFSPNGDTSRAMVATMLWRLEGSPVYAGASEFSDVDNEEWYGQAVRWANAEGIVMGDNGKFSPNDPVTREQLATMLYRYAQYKNVDVSVGADTNILSYDDAFSVSTWAMAAMQWACGSGIINGVGSNLAPAGNASRAQVATMLMRYSTAK